MGHTPLFIIPRSTSLERNCDKCGHVGERLMERGISDIYGSFMLSYCKIGKLRSTPPPTCQARYCHVLHPVGPPAKLGFAMSCIRWSGVWVFHEGTIRGLTAGDDCNESASSSFSKMSDFDIFHAYIPNTRSHICSFQVNADVVSEVPSRSFRVGQNRSL